MAIRNVHVVGDGNSPEVVFMVEIELDDSELAKILNEMHSGKAVVILERLGGQTFLDMVRKVREGMGGPIMPERKVALDG